MQCLPLEHPIRPFVREMACRLPRGSISIRRPLAVGGPHSSSPAGLINPELGRQATTGRGVDSALGRRASDGARYTGDDRRATLRSDGGASTASGDRSVGRSVGRWSGMCPRLRFRSSSGYRTAAVADIAAEIAALTAAVVSASRRRLPLTT
jgi:hypothetical protein